MTADEVPADDVTADELAALPIFPLPNAVLLPGGVMPLHVFEPRYRDLVRDCLAAARPLAIARLRPGYHSDYQGRPPVFARAGVGRIIASDETSDGRYLIALHGVARIEIERELAPTRSYREVVARRLIDDVTSRPADLLRCHQQLTALSERLSDCLDHGGDDLRSLLASCRRPGACADAIAAALVIDHDERQTLLERLDPTDRLERVLDHVGRLLCKLVSGRGPVN
jgi:uncharacterized protein